MLTTSPLLTKAPAAPVASSAAAPLGAGPILPSTKGRSRTATCRASGCPTKAHVWHFLPRAATAAGTEHSMPPAMEESVPQAPQGKFAGSTLSLSCLQRSNWTVAWGWAQSFASLRQQLPHEQKASHDHSPHLPSGLRADPEPSAEDSTNETPLGIYLWG